MDREEVAQQDAARVVGRAGVRLTRIGGTEIRLDPSLIVIFTLVVFSLGFGVLARWHPDWSAWVRWGTAIVAGILFFGSVLVHELAHAAVARLYGIPVPRITLFLFGGVAEMASEPRSPGAELAIAVVGPLASLLIGVVCTAAGVALAGDALVSQLQVAPQLALARLGVVQTLLLWLGPINILLGLFNLVPGFPLDGGRVVRAAAWQLTGDLVKATRWASFGGQLVGWLLIAWGLIQAFSGNFGGLWLALIGWFLQRAARGSHAELVLRHSLEGVQVRQLMRTRFESVPVDLPLGRFVNDYLLRGSQATWPVVDGGRTVGLVHTRDVAEIGEERRERLAVMDAMQPIRHPLTPEIPGREALRALVTADDESVPVVEGDRVVGLLHRGDVMRWLALREMDLAA